MRDLASGLDPERWRSVVVLPTRDWLASALTDSGVEPIVVKDDRRLGWLAGLLRTIRRERVDLIHAHLLGPASYGSLAALASRVPMICTFHGTSDVTPPSVLETVRYGLIRRAARTVVLVSEPLRKRLLATGRIPPQMTEVVPNGVDTTVFRPRHDTDFRSELGLAPTDFLIGAIGNLRPAKDYPTFLRAARAVLDRWPDAAFVIVGQTVEPMHRELLALSDDLGLRDRIRFTGFRSDVERVLNNLDLLLVSSSTEGFSLVTVQAMASGVPVVATRCGGPEQIIDHGEDGLLAPVGDFEALADAVSALRNQEGIRRRLVHNALEKAATTYSRQRMIQRYEHIYAGALQRKGS